MLYDSCLKCKPLLDVEGGSVARTCMERFPSGCQQQNLTTTAITWEMLSAKQETKSGTARHYTEEAQEEG